MSEKVKKYLENEVYDYDGPFIYDTNFKIQFKYKIKINGLIELISTGDLKKYLSVDIIIVDMPELYITVFGYFFKQLTDRQKVSSDAYSLSVNLSHQIHDEVEPFNLDFPVSIAAIRLDIPNA
jgi:hypothetical protein